MKTLVWNCQGLNNSSTFRAPKAITKIHNPKVIFLCETKATSGKMSTVTKMLGFDKCFCVEADGSARGICLV